jgi:hypothetical protein
MCCPAELNFLIMFSNAPTTPLIVPAPQRMDVREGSCKNLSKESVSVAIEPRSIDRPQSYRLTINSDHPSLIAHDEAGLFYGQQTLKQLSEAFPAGLPHLTVEDWPDLLVRGYMLDISRDRVPTLSTLKEMIDRLALLRINQLQLYTEHTIAYAGHEPAWRDASPMTFDQLREIEAYCRERFIELVPCQNLFGHLHRWLEKPEYAHLAECTDGWDTPWGYRNHQPFSLNPTDPRSFELSADLIDQLAPLLQSELFNIGCDETNDIGQGKSAAEVEKRGRGAVYLEYLNKLCGRVAEHGKTPMFWGDIVLSHPELVPRLPEQAILLNWNYEATKSFSSESDQFKNVGVRFYNCPGTSSWCSLIGRGQNAVDNMRDAAESAIHCDAQGYLITDWGDHGHWQPFAISWVGLTYGAGVAWCYKSNSGLEHLPASISRVAADAPTDELGRLLWRLSNVYLKAGPRLSNRTWWFAYLQSPSDGLQHPHLAELTRTDVKQVIDELEAIASQLSLYQPSTGEATRIKSEAMWSLRMTRWACLRIAEAMDGRAVQSDRHQLTDSLSDSWTFEQLIDEYRRMWNDRYRPGGLEDSVEKLSRIVAD